MAGLDPAIHAFKMKTPARAGVFVSDHLRESEDPVLMESNGGLKIHRFH